MQVKGAVKPVQAEEISDRSNRAAAASIMSCESCLRGIPCFEPAAVERARVSRNSKEGGQTRIVLCSDQPIMRSALHLLIAARTGYEVVIDTAICPSALSRLDGIDVDVLLLDFDLNDSSGDRLDRLQTVLSAAPDVPALILTPDPDARSCQVAFRFGVRGIVLKNKKLEDLFGAIDRIRRGETWLEGPALQKLLSQSPNAKKVRPEDCRIALLTRRELEIVKVVARGRTNRQIGEELFISDPTVRHHLCAIFDKLGVSSRGELIVYSYRQGLAEAPTPQCMTPREDEQPQRIELRVA